MPKQIQRIQDVFRSPDCPPFLYQIIAEARARKLDKLVTITANEGSNNYEVAALTPSLGYIARVSSGTDVAGMAVSAMWLMDKPHIIRPTTEQAEAMAHVSIDLSVAEFSSPYQTVLVELQDDPRFIACMVSTGLTGCLVTNLYSRKGDYDITTLIRDDGRPIETFLTLFNNDEDLKAAEAETKAANRVALNMCLAMVNYGCVAEPAYPKQLATDQALAKRDDESGAKARVRLREAMTQIKFTHEITVRRPTVNYGGGEPTGRTVAPHWVRGHWKRQHYGAGNSETKRILIKPYLVHAGRVDEIRHNEITVYSDRRN